MEWLLPIVAVLGTALLIITRKSRARVVQYVGFCTIVVASMWGIQHLPEGYDLAAFYGALVGLPLWYLVGPDGWRSRRPSART